MADNSVFITGAASGAFTEALNDLPPWATEDTAESIELLLKKSLDIQTKSLQALVSRAARASTGAAGLSAESARQVNDELDKLIKNLKKENDEDTKRARRRKEQEKAEQESLTRGKELKTSEEKMDYALGKLAVSGAAVLSVNKDYINVYDSLYKSGINVLNGNNSTADGFEALNQMVAQTGMRLQTLQSVLEKYSTTVNAVGVAKFSKAIALSNTQLQAMGYSSEAQAELLGAIIESESGYMDIRRKSAIELAADSIKLGTQLNRLSQTVGMSREQLQESMKATSKSTQTAFVFAKYGREAADKMNAAMAGVKDSGLKDTFMELAAAANPAQVKGYNELVQAGLGDVAEQMNQLAKSGMHLDPVEFQKRLSALTSGLEQQTGKMGNLTNLIGAGGEEAGRILNGLYQQGRGVSDATEGQQSAATQTQATVAKLQTEIESFTATLQKAFFPLIAQVDAVAASLGVLNGAVDTGVDAVSAQVRSWLGAGLIVAGFAGTILLAKKGTDTFLSFLGSAPGTLGRAVSGISGAIAGAAGKFSLFAIGLAKLTAAFAVGYGIGTMIYKILGNLDFSIKLFDKIFSGMDHILKYIPGLTGSEARERIDLRKAAAATETPAAARVTPAAPAAIRTEKPSSLSALHTPAPSTISSPSAVGVPPASPATDVTQSVGDPTLTAMPAIDRSGKNTDINNLLRHQGLLLEQILIGTNSLVSVNKDILRYSRNQ